MRNLALCSIVCLGACTASEARKEPERSPASKAAVASPMERSMDLYYRAWDAYKRGDRDEAHGLAKDSLSALDPETDENTTWQRVEFLRFLSLLFYWQLDDEDLGKYVWNRKTIAARRFDRLILGGRSYIPSRTRHAASASEELTTHEPTEGPPDPSVFLADVPKPEDEAFVGSGSEEESGSGRPDPETEGTSSEDLARESDRRAA